jgi:nitrogenase molybdenum-iron protein alpha chain
VDDVRSGCAQRLDRKFSQSGGCQLGLAMGIMSSLTNVVVIVHSPLGCCSGFVGQGGVRKAMRASKGKRDEEFIWLHTNMDELDVVAGGLDKLRDAVLYAEKEFHPDAIIIANGCVPGIIGDDIDQLSSELNGRLSAKIIPVHCEGFKSRYVASGYDSAYHGMLRGLVEPVLRYERAIPDEARDFAEKYRYSRTVNIFNVGSTSNGDEIELSRLVSELGLEARVVPLHCSLDELSQIGDSALNVSICATHDDYLLGHLHERFGTPYIIDTLPIGTRSTGRWLYQIAAHFGLEREAELVAEHEAAELREALKPFRAVLEGKTIYVGGGETRILTTADFFQTDLGMKVVGLKAHNVDRFVEDIVEELHDPGLHITVAAGQPSEELNLLKKLRPDIYCGHMGSNGWVSRIGIPNLPLFGMTINYMGYSGAYSLARNAAKVLKNTNFVKQVAENIGTPLSQEWYGSDTAANIKEAAGL